MRHGVKTESQTHCVGDCVNTTVVTVGLRRRHDVLDRPWLGVVLAKQILHPFHGQLGMSGGSVEGVHVNHGSLTGLERQERPVVGFTDGNENDVQVEEGCGKHTGLPQPSL